MVAHVGLAAQSSTRSAPLGPALLLITGAELWPRLGSLTPCVFMWSRRGACFLCGIHVLSVSLRTASARQSKRGGGGGTGGEEGSVEGGERGGIACLTCVCTRFGMDARLVPVLVQTDHTLDILVSHTLHATVST